MSDLSVRVHALGELEGATVGRGPEHPRTPRIEYAQLLQAHLSEHPSLSRHSDFVEFLKLYAGAQVVDQGRQGNLGLLFATVYGLGEFSFAEEAPPVTSDGFYVFAVVEMRPKKDEADVIASFAFDATGKRSNVVYAETHTSEEDDSPYRKYCSTFTEWLDHFVQANGRLLPSQKGQPLT